MPKMHCLQVPTIWKRLKGYFLKAHSILHPKHPMPALLALPPEIRNIIYAYVLCGTEQPLFLIENSEIWRCGPPSAFLKPGPPSLVRVCRLIAEEASQILHEVREIRILVISQGFPTGAISCYHRFCSLNAFKAVLERIQTLTLVVNTHPGHRVDEPFMELLDWIATLLEGRSVPIRNLGMILECCYGDKRRICADDKFRLAERFQELCPTYVEHWPYNGKCTWASVKQTEGRYRRAAVTFDAPGLLWSYERVRDSQRITAGMEDIGRNTLEDLRRTREVFERTHGVSPSRGCGLVG